MATYTVEVDNPNMMKGTPIDVPPLGVVENGSTHELECSREDAEYLATAFGITVKTDSGKDVSGKARETTEPPTEQTSPEPTEEGGET